MVLVTACHASSPREGIDFLPLTVDYREYTYASGRIPGGFFKREGKATEKETLTSRLIDRPIRPLFPAGWAYETQVIAFVLSADTDHDSDVLAITGASAALALSEMPLEKTIAGVRVGLVDGQYVVNPTFPERKLSRLDLIVAGQQGRHRDGRSRRPGGVGRGSHPGPRSRPRGDQGHLRADRRAGRSRPAARRSPSRGEGRRRRSSRRSKPRRSRGSRDAMRIKGKIENYATVAKVEKEIIAGLPEDQAARKGEAKGILHGLQEKVLRTEILDPQRAPRRPQVRRDPSDHHREQGAAPRPRLVGVHPRRNPGPGHRHPRHRRRPAEDRDGRRRDVEAVHAPLQLPALLGRRGEADARPRPPRDRPRRPRRARARADDAGRSRLRLHRAHRLRHPRVERQLVDGLGVRRLAGDDGRRRADQGRRSPAWRWASSWTRPPASTRC